jgi:nucleotide-binding universal stress UspA family protein
MYKRIMVAIDDSFASGKTLPAAIALAALAGAKLALCHALDQTIFAQRRAEALLSSSVSQAEQNLRNGAQEFLDQAAVLARAAGVDVETRIIASEVNQVAEMLAMAATDWQADLLVVGTHSHRGLERFFVDTVGERLVQKVKTSLLVVRE